MSVDFSKLSMMVGPRFKRVQRERMDRERLAATKHAKRAKGPKNHATNKERSYVERMKAAEVKEKMQDRKDAWIIMREKIRAYWRGEIDNYPRQQ